MDEYLPVMVLTVIHHNFIDIPCNKKWMSISLSSKLRDTDRPIVLPAGQLSVILIFITF